MAGVNGNLRRVKETRQWQWEIGLTLSINSNTVRIRSVAQQNDGDVRETSTKALNAHSSVRTIQEPTARIPKLRGWTADKAQGWHCSAAVAKIRHQTKSELGLGARALRFNYFSDIPFRQTATERAEGH